MKIQHVPKSPYGVSKLYSYWITKVYSKHMVFIHAMVFCLIMKVQEEEKLCHKKNYNVFCKKILGQKDILYLGNLNAKRDWGHAKDYTEMQWKILQKSKPDDYVIATGKTTSVRDFVNECCKYLKFKIKWEGKGPNEKGYLINNGKKELIIKVDKKYYRPLEIDYLRGDPRKAFKKLNYKLKHSLKDLVKDMLDQILNYSRKKLNEKN